MRCQRICALPYCCPLSPPDLNSDGDVAAEPEGWDNLEDADIVLDHGSKSPIPLDVDDDEVTRMKTGCKPRHKINDGHRHLTTIGDFFFRAV